MTDQHVVRKQGDPENAHHESDDQTQPLSPTTVTLLEAAELSGYTPAFLRRLIKEGSLQREGRGNDIRIAWADVKRLAAEQVPFWTLPMERVESPSAVLIRDPSPAGVVDTARSKDERAAQVQLGGDPGIVTVADSASWLKELASESVQSVITSPPYFGQRRYEDERSTSWMDGEVSAFGREKTVEAYVRHSLEVLRNLKRVLRADGTIWWVLGDTYQTRTVVRSSTTERWENYQGLRTTKWADNPDRRVSAGHPYLKDKDLTLVPFLVAHGAQHIGLYVRSMIIWSKQQRLSGKAGQEPSRTHMPEPVTDRPTLGHEYILLMSKSPKYKYSEKRLYEDLGAEAAAFHNLRSVWSFPVSTNHGGHTAAFPIQLPKLCISLSTEVGDLVIDPFSGSGNTLIAAKALGRRYAGCDISGTYAAEANARLAKAVTPMCDQQP